MPNPSSPVNNSVLSVSALNRLVRDCLESAFPLLWVGGEISNLTRAASGHVYFSLKDGNAQVRCVIWRNRAQLLGWRPENGQKVEANALVSFYEARGEFQLTVESLRRAGQGDLYERFLRLKTQLEGEGLFAAERKRPLPAFPRRLAIVTSLQAAALRDVLSTLHRRAPHIAVELYPAPVQGDGAASRLAAALAAAGSSSADAVILCRGGGSIEDLWAFNEETVARAIVACPLPVVAGIGHETDFTIADFAADRRAPTPTAAAELLSPERAVLLARLDELQRRQQRAAERQLTERQQTLDWLRNRLLHPAQALIRQRRLIDGLGERLRHAQAAQLLRQRLALSALAHRAEARRPQAGARQTVLSGLAHRLQKAVAGNIAEHRMKLNGLSGSLRQLDPEAVLARGYALVTTTEGRLVDDSDGVTGGDRLNVRLARGKLAVIVDQVVAPGEAD